MNLNEPFPQPELLCMPIDVYDIFDFVGNEFQRSYVLASKLVRARSIFSCQINQKFFQHLSKNIPIFFQVLPSTVRSLNSAKTSKNHFKIIHEF